MANFSFSQQEEAVWMSPSRGLQLVKCKASFKWWLSDTLALLYRKIHLTKLQLLYSILFSRSRIGPYGIELFFSMGGSVAVYVAAKKVLPSLAGLVVVDVVEIVWSVKGGSLRNIDAARVSIPSTLKYDDSKKWYEGLFRKISVMSCSKAFVVGWNRQTGQVKAL
ncbi:hypothetical protein F0562_003750 [Nyssa sinensis]|uniref:Uncharacterized protein n=1 Tax=Nyssa sinensis TaxID=561372 RepID=A0A5J5BXM5_9ASTE|nr:hypothetical protein F0562_003750 [Nyssa sinensis]